MKNSKRLLAVLMAVVMILTIVPLGLFAFAEDEDPTPPEPRTEINTIEIDSIAELQLIGNDDAYPVEPTKYTAEDGAEVTVNYVYKITKDLSAADESFDAWFASNEETARATFDKYVVVPEGITEIPEGAQYYVKNGDEYVAVDMTTVEKPVAADTYYTFEPRADFDTEALKQEGYVRDLVRGIQNLRKESGFEITDRINLTVGGNAELKASYEAFADFIKNETLAVYAEWKDSFDGAVEIEADDAKWLAKVVKA